MERLLLNQQVMIISPSPALPNVPISTNMIVNPVLYHDDSYNIVFKIGNKFPHHYHYLSVFLAHW